MDKNIITINSLDQVIGKSHEIQETVSRHGFALLRGLYDRDEIRSKLSRITNFISESEIHASSGVGKEEIRKNIVKYSIGSTSGSQHGISRMMLTVMNPMYENDILNLKEVFYKLITIRDSLAQRQQILFDDNLPSPKFNGTRVQVYPSGGGFLTAHTDSRAVSNLSGIKGNYIQLVLLLTEKGVDYQTGGAFVEYDEEIIDSEEGSLSGDVLVYDGNTRHGVADIDPELPLDRKGFKGRFVALATIYD